METLAQMEQNVEHTCFLYIFASFEGGFGHIGWLLKYFNHESLLYQSIFWLDVKLSKHVANMSGLKNYLHVHIHIYRPNNFDFGTILWYYM